MRLTPPQSIPCQCSGWTLKEATFRGRRTWDYPPGRMTGKVQRESRNLAIGDCSGKQIEITKARTSHCEEESKGHLRILSSFALSFACAIAESAHNFVTRTVAERRLSSCARLVPGVTTCCRANVVNARGPELLHLCASFRSCFSVCFYTVWCAIWKCSTSWTTPSCRFTLAVIRSFEFSGLLPPLRVGHLSNCSFPSRSVFILFDNASHSAW